MVSIFKSRKIANLLVCVAVENCYVLFLESLDAPHNQVHDTLDALLALKDIASSSWIDYYARGGWVLCVLECGRLWKTEHYVCLADSVKLLKVLGKRSLLRPLPVHIVIKRCAGPFLGIKKGVRINLCRLESFGDKTAAVFFCNSVVLNCNVAIAVNVRLDSIPLKSRDDGCLLAGFNWSIEKPYRSFS